MTSKRIKHIGVFDSKIYLERVSRSVCFLGRTKEEQERSQERLSNAVVGIAGTGGIGGAMALRLARLGIRHLKLADPQEFDWSNVNRQLGASKSNIGRNKAEVVGEIVSELAGDVTIEVYKDGITIDNANDFVSGCDIILDQLEFFVLPEKYALHRAFRSTPQTNCIMACSVVGWSAHLYKFEKDSMSCEDWYGLDENAAVVGDSMIRLIKLWAPKLPKFPTFEACMRWIAENDGAVPIFAGAPPLAEGILTQRVALNLIGLDRPPYAAPFAPIPSMYCYDAASLSGETVISDGNFKNEREVSADWADFDAEQSESERLVSAG